MFLNPGTRVRLTADARRRELANLEYFRKSIPDYESPNLFPEDQTAVVVTNYPEAYITDVMFEDGRFERFGSISLEAVDWNVEKPASFVTTGKIVAIDPCYTKDLVHSLGVVVKNARPGLWHAKRDYNTSMFGCLAPRHIWIFHESIPLPEGIDGEEKWKIAQGFKRLENFAGVDSGQIGFFDLETYPGGGDEEFYDSCGDSTLSLHYPDHRDSNGQMRSMAVFSGVVTGTNYGDGAYPVYVLERDGFVVGMVIDTNPEYEDDEDFDEDL